MANIIVPIIIAITIVWSIGGFCWFKNLYTYDPAHNETKKEVAIGGPIIWVMTIIINILNFFTIKK